jgi:hypothetical protein
MEKSLALMQYLNLPYFEVEGSYFQGNKDNARENYEAYLFDEIDTVSFWEWCNANCLPVEPEYNYIDDNYLVRTDEEADEAVKEYIKESVWAFNADFICGYGSPLVPMVKAYQEKECEGANGAILELITDLDDFVQRAINTDGRGHFLSSYDGEENEETVNGETYYIYRN